MTILLYDYQELEERTSRHLRVWKAWHTILYVLTAVCGILNYTFMQNTMQLVDNKCILFPRKLEFYMAELPVDNRKNTSGSPNETLINITNSTVDEATSSTTIDTTSSTTPTSPIVEVSNNENAQVTLIPTDEGNVTAKVKRQVPDNSTQEFLSSRNESTVEHRNATVFIGNKTHHLMLDTNRTLFRPDTDCQFVEYMPLLSAMFAAVWTTLFIMCPGGGRVRTGLQQPWRILTPALLFALVMVGLTGHSFTYTNGGLHDFCAHFQNYTNATTCSSLDPFLLPAWNTTWGFGGRVAATKAAAAGVWASWACVAALLLARCLAAPDFAVRRTQAYLKDPHQKITPLMKKSPRRLQRSPTKKDTFSVKSEPTMSTELVTASVEHDPDSEPTSKSTSPVRNETKTHEIEMECFPQKLGDN